MKRTFKVTQKIDASADLSTDWISISQRQLLKSPNIHFIFIMRPTFIAVVGTDGEDSKSNIGVLVHIHLIRCLCKCRLVIIYVTDKNTDIRGVWNNTNTDKKKNEIPRETKNIVTINIFRYLYSNLITFCQLVHAQRNIKNIFFFFLLSVVHLHSFSLCYCESRLVLFLLQPPIAGWSGKQSTPGSQVKVC